MINDGYSYRAASSPAGPVTLDIESRSIEAVGASELPVLEMDRRTYEVLPTVLLMSGCMLPDNGQLPLLDDHSRYGARSIIGSYRDLRIDGDKLIGRMYFTASPEVEPIWTRASEGHLTDVSVGRVDLVDPVVIPAGQAAMVDGRSFTGPIRVVTRWQPKEMSVTPIGADETAKVRSQAPHIQQNQQKQEIVMADETKRAAEVASPPAAAHPVHEAQPVVPVVEPRSADPDGFARAVEIINLCERHGIVGEQRSAMLKPEVTVDMARAAVLDALSTRSISHSPGFAPAAQATMGVDERDKFRAAANDALLLRAGFAVDAPASGADELRSYSLADLARRCLEKANISQSGNLLEMVGRAMTSTDLPQLMSNVANKSLFEGYDKANESWQTWCATGSVNDFKTNTLVQVSELDDLDQIINDAGYQYGERTDAAETFHIATFGKLFAITRTTFVNDDLQGLTDMLMAMGEAASRKVGDLPYAVLTANAAMRDSVALFHANHGNLGTAGVVSESSLAEAIKLAGLQKGLKSKQMLNIRLDYFIAPKSIEGAAETFFASTQFSSDNKASTRSNIYGGGRFIRAYDARLDAASAVSWYMAGPKGKTVKVFFLGGNQTPYMETKTGWNVDGVEYKVRIDAAAKATDWKALVKNPGA